MILSRVGNKRRIAHKIIPFFPPHEVYIEPFFGAGGMFFSKSKAKYNFLNDLDSDVFNLYQVVRTEKERLVKELELMPVHRDLFNFWRKNQETDDVMKAVRFLFLSNVSFLGKNDCMKMECANPKQKILDRIDATFEAIKDCRFDNSDFKRFLNSINFRQESEKQKAFAYCDPPYLSTTNNYSGGFKPQDLIDLFDVLVSLNIKFAVSEFENDTILSIVEKYKLNMINIGERQNLGNRKVEILVTNYENNTTLF